MISIIGHKNPDTDTICSAMAYEDFLAKKGIEAKAFALGDLNKESEFVLRKFEVDFPEVIQELPHNSEIILVDHNEEGQSIENLNDLDIIEIIDHHKVDLKTDKPIKIYIEPLGSSCSIIAKKFFEEGLELSQKIAQILIAGIISDTLFFRSPTTTETDKKLVEKLNDIAKIEDLEAFSMDMFNAKSDVEHLSIEEIVNLDYKEYDLSGHKCGLGVMETTNKDFGLKRKTEIEEYLKKMKEEKSLEMIFFSIVDILNEESYTLVSDEEEHEVFQKLFNAEEKEGALFAKGIVSRKKQILPVFQNHFNNKS